MEAGGKGEGDVSDFSTDKYVCDFSTEGDGGASSSKQMTAMFTEFPGTEITNKKKKRRRGGVIVAALEATFAKHATASPALGGGSSRLVTGEWLVERAASEGAGSRSVHVEAPSGNGLNVGIKTAERGAQSSNIESKKHVAPAYKKNIQWYIHECMYHTCTYLGTVHAILPSSVYGALSDFDGLKTRTPYCIKI